MNFSIYRFSLDLHEESKRKAIVCMQNDTKRRLEITLTENGKPYWISEGCSAIFIAVKADGTKITNDCTISENKIIYEFTEQTASAAGTMNCYIALTGDTIEKLTSPEFSIIVHAENVPAGEIISSDEYGTLLDLITEAKSILRDGNEVEY